MTVSTSGSPNRPGSPLKSIPQHSGHNVLSIAPIQVTATCASQINASHTRTKAKGQRGRSLLRSRLPYARRSPLSCRRNSPRLPGGVPNPGNLHDPPGLASAGTARGNPFNISLERGTMIENRVLAGIARFQGQPLCLSPCSRDISKTRVQEGNTVSFPRIDWRTRPIGWCAGTTLGPTQGQARSYPTMPNDRGTDDQYYRRDPRVVGCAREILPPSATDSPGKINQHVAAGARKDRFKTYVKYLQTTSYTLTCLSGTSVAAVMQQSIRRGPTSRHRGHHVLGRDLLGASMHLTSQIAFGR